MKPLAHLAGSAAAGGALYALTSSPPAALSCLLSGVLLDVDHFVDFFALSGKSFTPKAFCEFCYTCAGSRFLLPLHSYELFGLLALWASLSPDPLLTGAVAGMGLHLVMDQYGNLAALPGFRISQGFYFLSWRARAGFRKENLFVPNGRQNVVP